MAIDRQTLINAIKSKLLDTFTTTTAGPSGKPVNTGTIFTAINAIQNPAQAAFSNYAHKFLSAPKAQSTGTLGKRFVQTQKDYYGGIKNAAIGTAQGVINAPLTLADLGSRVTGTSNPQPYNRVDLSNLKYKGPQNLNTQIMTGTGNLVGNVALNQTGAQLLRGTTPVQAMTNYASKIQPAGNLIQRTAGAGAKEALASMPYTLASTVQSGIEGRPLGKEFVGNVAFDAVTGGVLNRGIDAFGNRAVAKIDEIYKMADNQRGGVDTNFINTVLMRKNLADKAERLIAEGDAEKAKELVDFIDEFDLKNFNGDEIAKGKTPIASDVASMYEQIRKMGKQAKDLIGNDKGSANLFADIEIGKTKPVEGSKYAFNINKEKLGVVGDEAKKVDEVVNTIRPVLEKVKGGPLTDDEIIRGVRGSQMLNEVVGRDEAKDFSEKLLASRSFLKSASKETGVTPEYVEQLRIVSSQAADIGRKLRAFGVDAQDLSLKEKVLKDVVSMTDDLDAVVAAGSKVDWNDPKQVTDFYREFKPASLAEKIDEFRYTNMLSSPNTHINNVFSNFIQTGVVAPVEKTLSGGIDFVKSSLTGREREYYAKQGVDYTKGYWKALPEAFDEAKAVFKYGSLLSKPDVEMIPTSTSRLRRIYTMPLTALEASDVFFRRLTESGEKAALKTAGIVGENADDMARESAEYRIFRQAFDPDGSLGQNRVLQVFDKWNSTVASMRNNPGGKYIVPFLQTPVNILKQGVEYSPLGISTVKGSAHPVEQLAKTMIGSTVFVSAYSLADAGLTTWDAPTNSNERSEFYAAGLQPYSVKIGDKWVSYSKIGPLAYPIAMASALRWAKDNNASEDHLAVAGAALGGILGFFADQSYMQGIGDLIDAARGDEFKQSRALANIPSQLVPYRAAQGWMARLLDPIYRKSSGENLTETVMASIASQIPGQSQKLEPYMTPFGQPSERQFPLLNAFSPMKVTQERPEELAYYQAKKQERAATKEEKRLKEVAGEDFSVSAKEIEGKNKIIYTDEDGDIKILNITPPPSSDSKVAIAKWENSAYKDALEILNSQVDPEAKRTYIESMGLNYDDVEYYSIANESQRIKDIYVKERAMSFGKDRTAMLQSLVDMRREVNGKMILTSTVISELVNEGLITKEEGTKLRKVSWDGDTPKVQVSGRGSGAKLKNIKFVPLNTKVIKTNLPSASNFRVAESGFKVPTKINTPTIKAQTVEGPKFNIKFNL